ncbi:hypothetical protein IJ541_07065 [bacterium]|nr:hypothetical protein [bacterium]
MLTIDDRRYTPSFRGPLDGFLTSGLRTLDTNPMANAVGIDLAAMVTPRTYIDTKKRNKYSGAETFFREFTGTLIVCLSASYFAKGIAKLGAKLIKPEIKINPNSWFSNDSLDFLVKMNKKSSNINQYIENVLNNISGRDGKNINKFSEIDWDKIDWVDEKRWNKILWDNKEFENIHTKLKDKKSIISLINKLINDKSVSKSDREKLQQILEVRLTNSLKAGKITNGENLSTSMSNLLRDMIDLGRDVFTNKDVNTKDAIEKIIQINKIKSLGAIALASTLGLSNQYINRKITEKRTGTKGFVGDVNYQANIKNKKSSKDTGNMFLAKKILASIGMAAMTIAVMKVKSPKDFIKKIELTGPVTSGNAIKTVYASTLIGRFMASDNDTELRETTFRDYFGFLNWLVFGGFAAKGVANLLDTKRENLFNISSEGKGIKYWLNEISLKSHNEIAAKGSEFAKKNMWKLNLAHAAGLAYSLVALGIVLPMINIIMTRSKQKNYPVQILNSEKNTKNISFEKFLNNIA